MLKKTQLNPPRGLSGKPLVDLLSERVPAIVKTTGTQIQLDRETNVISILAMDDFQLQQARRELLELMKNSPLAAPSQRRRIPRQKNEWPKEKRKGGDEDVCEEMLPARQSKTHEIRIQLESPASFRLQPHQLFRGEWRSVLDFLLACEVSGTSIVQDGNGLPGLFVSGLDELDVQTAAERILNYMNLLLGRPEPVSDAIVIDETASGAASLSVSEVVKSTKWTVVKNVQLVFHNLYRSDDVAAQLIDPAAMLVYELSAIKDADIAALSNSNLDLSRPRRRLPAFSFADGIDGAIEQLNRLSATTSATIAARASQGSLLNGLDMSRLTRVLDSLRRFPGDIRAVVRAGKAFLGAQPAAMRPLLAMHQAKIPTDFHPRLLFDNCIRQLDDGLLDRVYATLGLPFNQHLAFESSLSPAQLPYPSHLHSQSNTCNRNRSVSGGDDNESISFVIQCELPVGIIKESPVGLMALLVQCDRVPPPSPLQSSQSQSQSIEKCMIEIFATPHSKDPERLDCKKVSFQPRRDFCVNFMQATAPFDMQLLVETRHLFPPDRKSRITQLVHRLIKSAKIVINDDDDDANNNNDNGNNNNNGNISLQFDGDIENMRVVSVIRRVKQMWKTDGPMILEVAQVCRWNYPTSPRCPSNQPTAIDRYEEMEMLNERWQSICLQNVNLFAGETAHWTAQKLLGDRGNALGVWLECMRDIIVNL